MIFMMALMLSLGKSEPKFRRASLSLSFHKSKLLDPTFTRALPIKTTELAKYLQRMSNKCRDFLQTRVLHWSLDRLAIFGQIICFDSLMFCSKITSIRIKPKAMMISMMKVKTIMMMFIELQGL